MNAHEHYEELCAAAIGGITSADEFRELEDHLQDCRECRQRLGEYAQIGASALAANDDGASRAPKGMTARFVARAIDEGIPLREPIRILPIWASRHPALWAGTIAAGVVIVFLVLGNLEKLGTLRHRQESAIANATASAPRPDGGKTLAAPPSTNDTTKHLQQELNAAIVDKQRLAQAVEDLTDQIRVNAEHDETLTAQIAVLQSQLDQVKQQSSAKDAQIADFDSQLKRRQAQNVDQMASLAESQIRVQDLRDQLAERDATIREERQLLAAGSQARDLIIARNLHIIDVHDNNGEGERQRAFGRIFYTEGKQIVFYAYDLNSAAKLKQQVAFYVWGGRLGDEHAVKNLGIFHSEDAAAGRWALTFDDPHVLSQINTVFVTAESKKNVERPDGRQILFAYLGDKANHP